LEQYNYILVCGEEEMKTGTADVRNRDVLRKGANPMRIDEIAKMLEKEKPAPAEKETKMYAKAWSPEMFAPKEDEEFV
jgi:threonyl-tRNA synthetase